MSGDISFEQILQYFRDNGGSTTNREIVSHFKPYLTDPATKDEARIRFKEYVNKLAVSKQVNGEKFLYLKTRYLQYEQPSSPELPRATSNKSLDTMNSVGIPLSPVPTINLASPYQSPPRAPPPYRPPPPVLSPSVDSMSLSSFTMSLQEQGTPQPPPRRKSSEKFKLNDSVDTSLNKSDVDLKENVDNLNVSVKERREKFNRLASIEDELSPRPHKTPDKVVEKIKTQGPDEGDGVSIASIDPKKCVEWYVTASKGDFQELLKLAKDEPRLVFKKDPFTAYTVLHWGAKHGSVEIIKAFAGTYKMDVNSKTNGGYTPLHIAAQFGHKDVFKLLIEVYKANANLRDYSGRTPEYYFMAKEQTGPKVNLRKIKGRKKQSEKDLGFLRIGSLNVRVKKTTEAFSNFLGVGGGTINPVDGALDKIHKGWGSADNVHQNEMPAPKGYLTKKKSKRTLSNASNSTPTTPKQSAKIIHPRNFSNDSDSDTAAGFDSQWK